MSRFATTAAAPWMRGAIFFAAFAAPALALAAQSDPGPKGKLEHIVVIFGENVSFDHYFATYPKAQNPAGEPAFRALPGTPAVEGLSGNLLTANPNARNALNGAGATNPFRLDRSQAFTADQDHDYTAEQRAFNSGKMDLFPRSVGKPDGPLVPGRKDGIPSTAGLTMGYFDGNTVTALWNYAQRFAMSDRHFDVQFGPSTPGAINLVSGQTNGVVDDQNASGSIVADGYGGFTMTSDPQPAGDLCSTTADALVHMTGRNIGDILTAAGVRWGWFQGGFDLSVVNANGTTGCRRSTKIATGTLKRDYLPHHEPFQYYASTANPTHVRPQSVKAIGSNGDGANHQYDSHDFFDALAAGNFPAVVYLKAPAFQDAHSGYSTPLEEQRFVVDIVNALQTRKDWAKTAVILAYDDSDGWYDHVTMTPTNGSATQRDARDGVGQCGDPNTALPGVAAGAAHAGGRCGPGPRLPLLVISPWARANFVDHGLSDQTSVLRLIEDTFLDGARVGQGSFDAASGSLNNMFDFSGSRGKNRTKLFLSPETGEPMAPPAAKRKPSR